MPHNALQTVESSGKAEFDPRSANDLSKGRLGFVGAAVLEFDRAAFSSEPHLAAAALARDVDKPLVERTTPETQPASYSAQYAQAEQQAMGDYTPAEPLTDAEQAIFDTYLTEDRSVASDFSTPEPPLTPLDSNV